jgi:hypothetical protein
VLVVSTLFSNRASSPEPRLRAQGLHNFRLKFPDEGILTSKEVEFVGNDGLDALRLIQDEGRVAAAELWRDDSLLCVISRNHMGLFRIGE